MEITKTILISTLAHIDAIFLPISATIPHFQKQMEARKFYIDGKGIEISGRYGDQAERKEYEKSLKTLEKDGFLKIIRKSSRTGGVEITNRGEQLGRYLIAWKNLDHTIDFMQVLAKYKGGAWVPDWIPELCNFGESWGKAGKMPYDELKTRILNVEDLFLPAAVRGWCTSRCNTMTRNYYKLLPAGMEILDGTATCELYDFEEPSEAETKAYIDHYFERFKAANDWIKSRQLVDLREVYHHDFSSAI